MITDNWKEKALQKLAASAPQDDKAIAEAFAQQAYTVIGNRDREIMRDPYMLGFEIVYKNEENTRLVGVFAFRLPSEILLAPVFYNNGQIKGQDLLYRKGVNRFVPNTEKWVGYLLSRGEPEEGRGVDRQKSRARMNLDLAQLGGSRLKSAALDPNLLIQLSENYSMPPSKITPDMALIREQALQNPKESDRAKLQYALNNILEGRLGGTFPEEELDSLKTPADVQARLYADQPPSDPELSAKRLAELEQLFAEKLPKKASGEVDIQALWKEAMDAWNVTEPELLFADFLGGTQMQKQAAELAGRFPEWAELLELAGSLDKAATEPEFAAMPAPQPFTVQNQQDPLAEIQDQRLDLASGKALDFNQALQTGEMKAAAGPLTRTVTKHDPNYPKELDASVKSVVEDPAMQEKLKQPLPTAKTPDDLPPVPPTPITDKKAADVTLYLEPQPGWSETQLEDFYKQGFSLIDTREEKGLTDTYERSDYEEALATVSEPGIREIRDLEGNTARVLWAPRVELGCPVGCSSDRYRGSDYGLLFLDGPDKGAYKSYHSGYRETELPAFVVDREVKDEETEAGQKSVSAGKVYCAWIPSLGRMLAPFAVASVKTQDNVTKINFGSTACSSCPKLVINSELDGTDLDDVQDSLTVLGSDVRFFEVKAAIEYRDSVKRPENITWVSPEPPAEFRPVTVGRLGESLIKTKTACVTLIPVGRGRADLMLNGRRRAEDLDKAALSLKLAGNLGLSVAEALEYADRGTREQTTFNLISPRQKLKLAAAYYERDIDPDAEFEERDYDSDMDIPVYSPEDNQAVVEFRRHQQVSPQQNYLDAMGYGGGRNRAHKPQSIPDELIMQMTNPVEQMAQIGQQLGLKSLMDHGAVGAMTKIFDAAPHIQKYVSRLEESLDYMARLMFMLYWKPKDFADIFGSDDLPNMENKLNGVFLSYGDLVLELKQSAGEEFQELPNL